MIYEVSYANSGWKRAQKLNNNSALKVGGFDKIFSFSDEDIDDDFKKKNKKILSYKRGNGYWLWKPYFINKALKELKYGEYLMYCDSGAYFINNVKYLVDFMNDNNIDFLPFELDYPEKIRTKRDAFIIMNCDKKEYTDSNQFLAGYMMIKKTKKTEKVVKEWLKYAQDYRIITDSPNELGKPNYDGFIENRHDQTAYSLTLKKNGYKAYKDISLDCDIKSDGYPRIIDLHRIRIAKSKFQVHLFRIILPPIVKLRDRLKKIVRS